MTDMRDVVGLEARLAALIEELKPGGSQARCEGLRREIESVHREIEHRDRNRDIAKWTTTDERHGK
jgi:hypothetical protein